MELDTNQYFETLIPGFYITIEIRNYNRQYATTLNIIFTNNNIIIIEGKKDNICIVTL